MDLPQRFGAAYDFPLDDFQRAGVAALAADRSVLVAAPTGAGKTVVGEYAVWQALHREGKCFYTTPIKALSNQKFVDLSRRHGPERVGLLTGDNAVNGDAPVVVMTTEVLRNMLYEGSPALVGLHAVVLDEVHYLADRERGAVWEEVIVQLPPSVALACLSATLSNAEEFGRWLRGVRESCDVVISERRPVPLEHSYAVNDRVLPTFVAAGGPSGRRRQGSDVQAARQARGGRPNPEVLMLERRAAARVNRRGRRVPGPRPRAPRRFEMVEELARRDWLPAIYFLFSRAGCDDAVDQLVAAGVSLTTAPERARIRGVVAERTAPLPAGDLDVLDFAAWASALERGVAAHHAGMVPVFKETVERLFVDGLVKACFATETLALGINMPARTVVIERLEKWNGQRHELLTPGQFTQLTGRAGRRGLDRVGHAVVLYQRDVDFPTVASLVDRRVEPLRSSFAPSYNMAVNLLRRHSRAGAERLLASSFAQFQTDATVVDQQRRIAENRRGLDGYAANLRSDHGDFAQYWALRTELARLESAVARERRQHRRDAVLDGVDRLREGDVVLLPKGGRRPPRAAIVGRSRSSTGTPLAQAVTEDRRLIRLGPREFPSPPWSVGRVPLPAAGGPRQPGYRRAVAEALHRLRPDDPAGGSDAPAEPATTTRLQHLRRAVREHPVHHDPALEETARWARRHDELAEATERLERSVHRRTGSLVRDFDRIVEVLTAMGYLTDDRRAPQPTEEGLRLAGLYADTDLVLAEALRRGVLDGLDAADLAAVASVFVHETRTREPAPPRLPTPRVREAVDAAQAVWADVVEREADTGLSPTRPLDPGFADVTWRWASGQPLQDALGASELTAGDFVRATKQVADLLRQLRDVTRDDHRSPAAHQAARRLVRGVVAFSGV
ncbi:MAG: DEAD/DEAH box helicase [Actinobacteria bacterium]|nr:DEAD/DEAH box helicase [Actinomycetota bacterium]